MDYEWIVSESKLPWLKLDLEVPYEEMLNEAKSLKEYFVKHRDEDYGPGGYGHRGWRSLAIHGIDAFKTNHFTEYGYESNDEVPYKWTEITSKCPVTKEFFQNVYPFDTYYRVRFMLLEPAGFITPHTDTEINKLSPVNIALNHPEGCLMKMKGHDGYVPFKPGTALMLDVGNTHAYVNKSYEDRFHIIVHGKVNKQFKELVERSYEKNGT